ncbi:hypothetical protein F0267_17645 [Vibrio coralliilyticus]|uniref:Uncharacterized protein n=1 Tax=Vibrio coralliilyticus TaxID=190893 RepID=A0AAN0SGS2_9VIBR|nr:hypothetical protein [Vibrio coralliilyticus]AIW21041.1 hypothetical protein IX92_18585 [Vibrio coralliilyticus]NOH40045.1 hypothetical protein [Vibrio coralliilyticus]
MYRKVAILLVVYINIVGCSSTIFKKFDVAENESVSLDARQRTIIVQPNHRYSNVNGESLAKVVCAEPSPDALSALSASLAGSANYKDDVAAKLSSAISESAKGLGVRNATIQLLRDGLYRACEAYANGALDEFQYGLTSAKYEDIMVTLLAIEQLTSLNLEVTEEALNTSGSASNNDQNKSSSANSADGSTEFKRNQLSDTSIKVIAEAVTNMVGLVLKKDERESTCLAWFADKTIHYEKDNPKLIAMTKYCDTVFDEKEAFLKNLPNK